MKGWLTSGDVGVGSNDTCMMGKLTWMRMTLATRLNFEPRGYLCQYARLLIRIMGLNRTFSEQENRSSCRWCSTFSSPSEFQRGIRLRTLGRQFRPAATFISPWLVDPANSHLDRSRSRHFFASITSWICRLSRSKHASWRWKWLRQNRCTIERTTYDCMAETTLVKHRVKLFSLLWSKRKTMRRTRSFEGEAERRKGKCKGESLPKRAKGYSDIWAVEEGRWKGDLLVITRVWWDSLLACKWLRHLESDQESMPLLICHAINRNHMSEPYVQCSIRSLSTLTIQPLINLSMVSKWDLWVITCRLFSVSTSYRLSASE